MRYGDGRTEAQEHADDSQMIRDGLRAAFPSVATRTTSRASGSLIDGDCFDADVCVMAANCPFLQDCRMVEDDGDD